MKSTDQLNEYSANTIATGKKNDAYFAKLATGFEKAGVSVTCNSLNGSIKTWNHACVEMFGYTPDDMIGKNISLTIPPQFIAHEKTSFDKIVSDNTVVKYESCRIKKNLESFQVEIITSPVKNEAGEIIGVCKIIRDITIEKQLVEMLNSTNMFLSLQQTEKENRAQELLTVDAELAFQNKGKKNHANELLVANKELASLINLQQPLFASVVNSSNDAIFTCTDIDQVKQSKELIKREKALSDYVINSLPGIFYLFDETGKFLRWNKQFELISGYNTVEITDMHPIQFFRGDDIQLITEKIGEVFSKGESRVEATLVTKDNRKIPFHFNCILTSYNEKSCIIGISVDITEQKKTEKELKNLTNRLQLATTGAGMGIWDWHIKTNRLIWDEGMNKLYKIDNGLFTLDFEGWISRIHIEDRERIASEVQLAIANKKDYDTEFKVVWDDASIHHIRATAIVERDKDGNPNRMIGANWDITERRKTVIALQQSEARLKGIIDSQTAYLLRTDLQGNYTYCNQKFKDDFGWIHSAHNIELIGVHSMVSIMPYHHEAVQDVVKKCFDNPNQVFQIEIDKPAKNNGVKTTLWDFTLLTDPDSRPDEMQCAGIDITDRKKAEIELKQVNEHLQQQAKKLALSNEELEHFAFVASHDLQEPLRMVTNFMTQLERKYSEVLDEKAIKYIGFAVDGARRMRQIILDLLEFSRVGKTLETESLLDLDEILSDIKVLLKKKIAEKKATIVVDNLPKIYADISPIRQVFQNLLANALEYSIKDVPVQIRVTAEEKQDFWQFAVADNGIGISKEYYEKIFVIFQRLHSKEDHPGTGLGLAITKKIIEAHGGKIWVESEEGKGSTFYFTVKK